MYLASVNSSILVVYFSNKQGKIIKLSILNAIQWKHLLSPPPDNCTRAIIKNIINLTEKPTRSLEGQDFQ